MPLDMPFTAWVLQYQYYNQVSAIIYSFIYLIYHDKKPAVSGLDVDGSSLIKLIAAALQCGHAGSY
jgi:hypothetical protein